MNASLQAVIAGVKTSRATQLGLVCVLSIVVVLAMVMAFRGPAGQGFVGAWSIPDPVRVGRVDAFDRALDELIVRIDHLAPTLEPR